MMRIVRCLPTALWVALFGLAMIAPSSESLAQHTKRTPAKKKVVKVIYKAQCGMKYTEAQAKKHKFICPMDKKPLKKVVIK